MRLEKLYDPSMEYGFWTDEEANFLIKGQHIKGPIMAEKAIITIEGGSTFAIAAADIIFKGGAEAKGDLSASTIEVLSSKVGNVTADHVRLANEEGSNSRTVALSVDAKKSVELEDAIVNLNVKADFIDKAEENNIKINGTRIGGMLEYTAQKVAIEASQNYESSCTPFRRRSNRNNVAKKIGGGWWRTIQLTLAVQECRR